MNTQQLQEVAKQMVAPTKGILAMDESTGTCTKRFEAHGVQSTEENRRKYRSLLVTASGLGQYISGAILYDETIRQKTDDGTPIPQALSAQGILPGIKVDTGAKEMALFFGEKVTEGLDGLRDRLKEYVQLGAKFCKWRAVIAIGDGIPSDACVHANAHALARYAALCQEAGLVPIVEPEVLMTGSHNQQACYDVTVKAQKAVFEQLQLLHVDIGGIVLKPNMIVSGKDSGEQVSAEQVAEMTVKCLRETVPLQVPGVAFLSGGLSDADATGFLDLMNKKFSDLPWRLTFSYGRGLQREALKTWAADMNNVSGAQDMLLKRAKENSLASQGKFS